MQKLLKSLYENGSMSSNIKQALKNLDVNGDGKIDFLEFKEIHKKFPLILFPLFKFQISIRRKILGEGWWKMKQLQLMMIRHKQFMEATMLRDREIHRFENYQKNHFLKFFKKWQWNIHQREDPEFQSCLPITNEIKNKDYNKFQQNIQDEKLLNNENPVSANELTLKEKENINEDVKVHDKGNTKEGRINKTEIRRHRRLQMKEFN